MRILPGLAYNDMKRILAGFFSMAGKSTPAPGRLFFDGREECLVAAGVLSRRTFRCIKR